ncbi:unnamed protein product [Paramecium sonneborni]|uniref:Uncharacterized protein n=1 Tax=Paramecium sonneborni TaxID=65129 RepID=A0A8S1K9F2_9CILI|nr:unnamed protein product [Paramecium sonneborni]
MHLTEKEPFFPVLLENRNMFRNFKRRYNSTQPMERKMEKSMDSFQQKAFLVQKKELQLRTLEPKKQYVVKPPKTTIYQENIPQILNFDKMLCSFMQLNNQEKNQKNIKKKCLKIITQHHELDILEEEHKSLQSRFFTEVQSYLNQCHRF